MSTPETAKRAPWWRRELFGLVRAMVVLPGSLSLLGFLGTLHWRLELFAHFTLVFFWAALAGTALMAAMRSWRWAAVGLVIVLANGAMIVPFYLPGASGLVPHEADTIRLLCANVLRKNNDYQAVLDYVAEADPDIVLLQETSAAWRDAMAPLREKYPTHWEAPREDDFGIALYTRLPGAKAFEVSTDNNPAPVLALEVRDGERTLTFYNVHATPPVNAEAAQLRNSQLDELAEWVNDHAGRAVIAGDLNITPWSPYYRRFIKETGLVNARRGFGVMPTWPQDRKFPLLPRQLRFRPFMPIDHVLLPPDAQVVLCERGPNIGSDHRPLLVDFYFGSSPEVKGAAVQAISMSASNS